MLSSSKEVKPKKLLKGKKLPLIRATRFLALALLCPPPLWSGLPCTNLRSKFLASDLQANLSEVRLTSKFLTTVFQGGKKHNRVVAKKWHQVASCSQESVIMDFYLTWNKIYYWFSFNTPQVQYLPPIPLFHGSQQRAEVASQEEAISRPRHRFSMLLPEGKAISICDHFTPSWHIEDRNCYFRYCFLHSVCKGSSWYILADFTHFWHNHDRNVMFPTLVFLF